MRHMNPTKMWDSLLLKDTQIAFKVSRWNLDSDYTDITEE